MTISTKEVDDCFFCSCSLGSVCDTNHDPPSWITTLTKHIRLYRGNFKSFLKCHVPARTPYRPGCDPRPIFHHWRPTSEGCMDTELSKLVSALNDLVVYFPRDKRLSFVSGRDVYWPGPSQSSRKRSMPELFPIVARFPGDDVGQAGSRGVSLLIDVGMKDPFRDPKSLRNCKTLINLAHGARIHMDTHSLLAAFVVGIYSETVRIIRFDNAAAVFSEAVSIRDIAGAHLLKTFLWNFVHPCDEVPFVGWDPHRLQESFDVSSPKSLDVYDEAGEQFSYIVFKPLASDRRLFSRATTVWLGIRDTRRLVNDYHVHDNQAVDFKVNIIKDAWRRLDRLSEDTFYARLAKCVPPEEYVGLPRLSCGGDLGEREVQLWENSLYGVNSGCTPRDEAGHLERLQKTSTMKLSAIPHDCPESLLATTCTNYPPRHRPLQQTFSWRNTEGGYSSDRSHIRLSVDTVGRPITKFRSTKELVTALRDAILGHRAALCRAGILHRDISVGNILIVEDETHSEFRGFLHDFDYSSMSAEPPNLDPSCPSSWSEADRLVAEANPKEIVERTGTFDFMSMTLHNRHAHCSGDDLQSYYWVLVWVVIAHTAHSQSSENHLLEYVFPPTDDIYSHLGGKIQWLISIFGLHTFSIPNNPPLIDLLNHLGELIKKTWARPDQLDYGQVLDAFNDSLARSDWPADDAALPYRPPPLHNCPASVLWPHERTCCKERAKREQRATAASHQESDT